MQYDAAFRRCRTAIVSALIDASSPATGLTVDNLTPQDIFSLARRITVVVPDVEQYSSVAQHEHRVAVERVFGGVLRRAQQLSAPGLRFTLSKKLREAQACEADYIQMDRNGDVTKMLETMGFGVVHTAPCSSLYSAMLHARCHRNRLLLLADRESNALMSYIPGIYSTTFGHLSNADADIRVSTCHNFTARFLLSGVCWCCAQKKNISLF